MRRLRAAAAMVALAILWLGYSVAHQIAAELFSSTPQQSQATSSSGSSPAAYGGRTPSAAPTVVDQSPAPLPGASIASADVPGEIAAAPGLAPAIGAPGTPPVPFVNPLLPLSEQPSSSASHSASAGMPGASGGFRRGASGSGAPSLGGGGGSAGGGEGHTESTSPASGGGEGASGSGVPKVLGHRLSTSPESGDESGSSGKSVDDGSGGDNGSNGSNGSSGSNGSNGSNGSEGSNGSSGDNGSNGDNGPNGSNGSSGSNGSDQGSDTGTGGAPSGEGESLRTSALSVDVADKGDEPLTVPEPGVILLGLGATAALARRRRP